MSIYTVRTTAGREKSVLESLTIRIRNKGFDIKAVLSPGEIKGYIFMEGDEESVASAISGIPHVRGFISTPVDIKNLEQFFTEELPAITIKEGDLVEVVGGPFKREKAKIKRIDEAKREAKIELVDSAVPVPITIKLDLLKILRRESESEE